MAEAVDLGDLDRPELTSADYDGDLDLNLLFNLTSQEEWDCIRNGVGDEASAASSSSSSAAVGASCGSVWDGILCWPTTPAGSTAVMSCREELNGVNYDATREFNLHLNSLNYILITFTFFIILFNFIQFNFLFIF